MYFIFNYLNKAVFPINTVSVLYLYNSFCRVLQEQRHMSTMYDKTMLTNIKFMEKEIYHHGSFTFSRKTQPNFHSGNLAHLQNARALSPLEHRSMYLNVFQSKKWIRMQIKLSELETQSKLAVTLHRSNNLISFLLLPECFLLSCVTAGTAGQNCSLALHPRCQTLKQQGKKAFSVNLKIL